MVDSNINVTTLDFDIDNQKKSILIIKVVEGFIAECNEILGFRPDTEKPNNTN